MENKWIRVKDGALSKTVEITIMNPHVNSAATYNLNYNEAKILIFAIQSVLGLKDEDM